ncbi:hypothetical protein LIER_42996 [Lithospermum erythrorhizon]|uniref:Uncharacterized protein n=1 Tax=Lithospermum erythrorhizon TaxID=34254 RepID=A0AAV3PAC6_LITER
MWKKLLQVRELLQLKIRSVERPCFQVPPSSTLSKAHPVIPSERRLTHKFRQVLSEFQQIQLSDQEDRCVWFENGDFTQASMSNDLRNKGNKLPWGKWLWSRLILDVVSILMVRARTIFSSSVSFQHRFGDFFCRSLRCIEQQRSGLKRDSGV